MLKKLLAWTPALLAVAALLYLTLQPPGDTMAVSRLIQGGLKSLFEFIGMETPAWVRDTHTLRSVAHIPEYLILGCALYVAFRAVAGHPALWTFGTGGLIGLLDEGMKYLLPTRHFELRDWGLDWVGLLMAVLMIGTGWLARHGYKRRRARQWAVAVAAEYSRQDDKGLETACTRERHRGG